MTAFAFYLLKVVLCSGIFLLYYVLLLRNRLFHQWNRFYLLASVVVSLAVPLLQFTVYRQADAPVNGTANLIQVVQSANGYLDEVALSPDQPHRQTWLLPLAYALISLGFLTAFVRSLLQIRQIRRRYTAIRLQEILFYNTSVPGTPFCFFRSIFWNEAIDPASPSGQKILQHEIVHVREKHSLDKVLMQVVLSVFWCNPFFWLLRRELKTIHEFIADRKAIGEQGPGALAEMILYSVYPRQYQSLTHPFFQTSIKRRLAMLTKIQNPRLSYFSRIAALPLLALTFLAFTVKTKFRQQPATSTQSFTVVIDAGHGRMPNGEWNGARSGNLFEDEITLSIARKVRELNNNPQLKIILTREGSETVNLSRRVEIARENHADAFISIHVNALPPRVLSDGKESEDNSASGLEVDIARPDHPLTAQNQLLGSLVQSELSQVYSTASTLITPKTTVYVLQQSPCPAALVECGYITNEKDRSFMASEANQKALALRILAAVERFANSPKPASDQQLHHTTPVLDTVPRTKEVAAHKTDRNPGENNDATIDPQAWSSFLTRNLGSVLEGLKNRALNGTYTVRMRFAVEEDGSLSEIEALDHPGYDISLSLEKLLQDSPRWQPAVRNGKSVKSYRTQPITFVVSEGAKPPVSEEELEAWIPKVTTGDMNRWTRLEYPNATVTEFTLVKAIEDKIVYLKVEGNRFTEPARDFLSTVKTGDIVTIENVRGEQEGKPVKLPSKLYQIVQ